MFIIDGLLNLITNNGVWEFIWALILFALLVLFVILIKAILLHPLYSRIAGLIVAIMAFIFGLNIPESFLRGGGETVSGAICLSIFYTFSFLFAQSANVFDTYWDGTYTLSFSQDKIDLSENISGGFLHSFIAAAIAGFVLSLLALTCLKFLLWLIPVVLAIANIALLGATINE